MLICLKVLHLAWEPCVSWKVIKWEHAVKCQQIPACFWDLRDWLLEGFIIDQDFAQQCPRYTQHLQPPPCSLVCPCIQGAFNNSGSHLVPLQPFLSPVSWGSRRREELTPLWLHTFLTIHPLTSQQLVGTYAWDWAYWKTASCTLTYILGNIYHIWNSWWVVSLCPFPPPWAVSVEALGPSRNHKMSEQCTAVQRACPLHNLYFTLHL